MTDSEHSTEPEDQGAAGGRVEALVMRLSAWRKKTHAKRLYKRIWKANMIILGELHGSTVKQQNHFCKHELEACSDALEHAAGVTKKVFDA